MEQIITWRFDFMIPTITFLIFFLVFYFIRPVLLTKSNKYYLSLIIFELIGFFVTTYSCYMDLHAERYSRLYLTIINNLYYNIYNARYFIISLYFASFLNIKPRKDIPTSITGICLIATIFLFILNPIHTKIYVINSMGRWEKGNDILIPYIMNLITLFLDLYYLIRYHKKFNKRETVTVIFAIISLLACGILDIFCTTYIITDIFFTFEILLLYLGFENPDNFIDKRTNLYNGQAFITLIQQNILNNKKYSVISFIIQNYTEKKQIYGTKQMDKALAEIARFLPTVFKGKQIFYMSNGNFIVIEKNLEDNLENEKKVTERFNSPWLTDSNEIHLNVFVIDSADNVHFSTFENIMAGYTIAFNEAITKKQYHTTITRESYDAIKRKTKVSKALNQALLEDSLLVYLQPIVDSKTRKIIAAEALVRIYDDEIGLIQPSEFITLAERNGSIEQLGEQVLNKVCCFLNESHLQNQGIKWINVNLSPVQCQNLNLPKKINNIVSSSTIEHKYIHLEITEDSMIETQRLMDQMNILITNGYKFSLDDFGSGFSNVVKVKTYPFSNIKLDLSLVWDHFEHPSSMLPSMVNTFKERGLTITAEGVETKEMADGLEKMGVDYLQGYYFSKPIPMKDFVSLLDKQNSTN